MIILGTVENIFLEYLYSIHTSLPAKAKAHHNCSVGDNEIQFTHTRKN